MVFHILCLIRLHSTVHGWAVIDLVGLSLAAWLMLLCCMANTMIGTMYGSMQGP